MNALSLRTRAISTFSFDCGISTRRCFALTALRMRVSMSAIGSVIVIVCPRLPTGLAHARQEPVQRHIPEADSAQAELAEEGAGATAPLAAVVLPNSELGLALALLDHCLTSHLSLSKFCRGFFPPGGWENGPVPLQSLSQNPVGDSFHPVGGKMAPCPCNLSLKSC